VAAILKEHRAVQVSVCSVATERDRAALSASPSAKAAAQTDASKTTDDALLELAKNRTKRIEDQLVNVHAITAKRIIACKPEIDKSAEANPRVDLAL
jgi:hypothetical protein